MKGRVGRERDSLSCGDTGILGWGKGAAQEASKNLLSLQGTLLSPTPSLHPASRSRPWGWTPGFSVTEEVGTAGTLNSIRNALTTVIITGLQRKLTQSLKRCLELPM